MTVHVLLQPGLGCVGSSTSISAPLSQHAREGAAQLEDQGSAAVRSLRSCPWAVSDIRHHPTESVVTIVGLLVVAMRWMLNRDTRLANANERWKEKRRGSAVRRFLRSPTYRRGRKLFYRNTLKADDRGVVSIEFRRPKHR